MEPTQLDLFDLSSYQLEGEELRLQPVGGPVWTRNKAILIQKYVNYFTYITRHGTYLDCFSGPQEFDHPDTWAAKLVLELKPEYLRHFVLFEKNKLKVSRLEKMVEELKPGRKRSIKVISGDMNEELRNYFTSHPIRDKEATFCLLDQHTFECNWATVEMIASHKQGGHKIEQFYFLAQSWIDRAEAGMKIAKDERLEMWWGNREWQTLFNKRGHERGQFLAERFKKELGYRYAYPFPIYEKPPSEGHGKVMFYMIHASDHPEATRLMVRAYNKAVTPLETPEQLKFELADILLPESTPLER